MINVNPILITGVERSASSIIARIYAMCGAFTGTTNQMYENVEIRAMHHFYIDKKSDGVFMPDLSKVKFRNTDWYNNVVITLLQEGFDASKPFVYKDSGIAQMHQLWKHNFPQAKWIIVRRRTGDIIQSCKKTAYMDKFKNIANCKLVGVHTEEQGWLWWVHQYERKFIEIMQNNPNMVKEIYPERLADKDFSQIKGAIEWCGLKWNEEIETIIPQLLRKGEN
jgi:hypothetical protein